MKLTAAGFRVALLVGASVLGLVLGGTAHAAGDGRAPSQRIDVGHGHTTAVTP